MKTIFVCVEAGNEGVKLKADWAEWTDELTLFQGKRGDFDNSSLIAVFKKWEYFFEVQE